MADIHSLDEENGAERTRPAVLEALKKAEQNPSVELSAMDPEKLSEARPAVLKALKKAEQDPSAEISTMPPMDPEKQAVVEDKRADTELKRFYAYRFIWILIGQLVVLNLVFIAIGLGFLKYSDFVINLFLGGTLLEVFGVVLVITKYLFSRK
jgi:hypothetical protein